MVRAVGEIGLDYHYDFSPRDVQQAVFRAQLRWPGAAICPWSSTRARPRTTPSRILGEAGRCRSRGVFHCFTGDAAAAARALATGFYLSLPGIVTFPKAAELRDAVRDRARSTGCSSRPTARTWRRSPHRGKRNEPAYVSGSSSSWRPKLGMSTSGRSGAATERTSTRLFRP